MLAGRPRTRREFAGAQVCRWHDFLEANAYAQQLWCAFCRAADSASLCRWHLQTTHAFLPANLSLEKRVMQIADQAALPLLRLLACAVPVLWRLVYNVNKFEQIVLDIICIFGR